jgi:ATP-dependent helicase/nuclease subunit A
MSAMGLTSQQQAAITTVGRELLIAASAGTGKTTVLAQRVMHLLLLKKVALKEILAVTFTDAAAADMRRKIANELREYVAAHRDDIVLSRELLLIDRAPISTLHSFCLKVLREHFHQIDLDPGFGIIDPDEADLLKAEVADRLLEEWFAREDEDGKRFLALADAYGGPGGQRLVDVILRLHEFLQTLCDPDEWRARVRKAYSSNGDFLELAWHDAYVAAWKRELEHCRVLIDETLAMVGRLGSVDVYRPHLEIIKKTVNGWQQQIEAGLTSDQWTTFLNSVRTVEWGKLPSAKGAPKDDREAAQAKIKNVKGRIAKYISGRLAAQTPQEIVEDIYHVGPFVDLLLTLQQKFEQKFKTAKDQQALLDFNDLERLCYELLDKKPDVARHLRQRFKHVLVDEYQDINPLQDAILQLVTRPKKGTSLNQLFMVGDEKQSIYGFRLAAPDIFMEKYHRFSPDLDQSEVRIPLTHNFRCRAGIIHAVNHIFERIVVTTLGNVYGPEAVLTYGSDYPLSADIPDLMPVEVHLLEKDLSAQQGNEADDTEQEDLESGSISMADESTLEREAFLVGLRIKDLIEKKTPVWDGDQKRYRPARYRDVVILLRTTTRRADLMAGVLRNLGVPVYAALTSGFFEATEVRDMIALFEILDNAQQDVPLAAVLRSPLVGLSDDNLTEIRTHTSTGRFHVAVQKYRENGSDTLVRTRLEDFQKHVDRWRKDVLKMPLARVVWEIYRSTQYLNYVQGLPGGEGRRANLVQLHDRARQFDQFSRRGLFRFLRFLRRLKDADQDLGTAPVLSESDDVVRIMSIHKSKGLEFPIVFVPDLAKQFNLEDLKQQFLLHRRHLLGTDRVDLDRMAKAATLPKRIITEKKRVELLAEEQRLLYVAMTRARERLFLCGTVDLERASSEWAVGPVAGRDTRVLAANCMLDWLGPVLADHPDTARLLGAADTAKSSDQSRFDLQLHQADEINKWTLSSTTPATPGIDFHALVEMKPVAVITDSASDAAVALAYERLQWNYPSPHLKELPGKVSVTGFKRRFQVADEDDQPGREQLRRQVTRKPLFLAGTSNSVTAAERGSATHAVLQHLDFTEPLDTLAVQAQIAKMVESKILGHREAEAVDVNSIIDFFARPLGQRLLHGKSCLRREVPFSLLLPAGELPDAADRNLTSEERRETILIQGIIDCLLFETVGVVLLDYKTDNISAAEAPETATKYGRQVVLYRRAVQAIYEVDVKESYLVFMTPGIDILVK